MPIAPLRQRIKFHVRRSTALAATASRLHARAGKVLERALTARADGHPRHAKLLAERAFRVKARAVRHGVRAAFHVSRIVHLRTQVAKLN
jgi:hypothetical protein